MSKSPDQLREMLTSMPRFQVIFTKKNGERRKLIGWVRSEDQHRATPLTLPTFDETIGEVRNVPLDRIIAIQELEDEWIDPAGGSHSFHESDPAKQYE